MATRALRPCAHPGCPALVPFGRCDQHRRARQRLEDRNRSRPTRLIYGTMRWRRFRVWFLRNIDPLCRFCLAENRTTPATEVDHIVELDVAPDRAFDPTNCRGLCKPCHSRRTAKDQRGWGNQTSKGNNA